MTVSELESHPYTRSLLESGRYVISKPYETDSEDRKAYSLTSGTLIGPDLIAHTPLAFSSANKQKGESELVILYHLGSKLCGHRDIIHGGLLATLLDETLCRCGFAVLPNHVGVTASLNTNYLKPTPADSFIVLKAQATKVEGRKVWVEGSTFILPREHEYDPEADLIETVSASLLAVEPRWASKLTESARPAQ
ncbi:hypothetical protein TRVA0_007S02608 [Trichomonascus vanleenenianus]|uniref:PaaI family thioesterase n=1 Tax=Trichomonascus vanleenenianus TaxID=2268995 RepID=UPI003ECA6EAB